MRNDSIGWSCVESFIRANLEEKIIELNSVDPTELFGINDTNLKLIRSHFPKVKVVARGNAVKALGDSQAIEAFESKLIQIMDYLKKHKQLSENNIERILESQLGDEMNAQKDEVLVFGNHGLQVKAKSFHQRKMVESISKNDMVFGIGPAGTGKTYTAVALAVRALREKEVKRIILTRPAVEAGESLGFLPGDFKEKLDPYLQPLYDALRDMLPKDKLGEYIENGTVQIAPLAYMRGRTLDKAFVILDEAQNASESQFKMFLTRMGRSAKFIVTGDVTQIDLPKNQPSGLIHALKILNDIKGLEIIYFDDKDVMRHKLVKEIINAYGKENKDK